MLDMQVILLHLRHVDAAGSLSHWAHQPEPQQGQHATGYGTRRSLADALSSHRQVEPFREGFGFDAQHHESGYVGYLHRVLPQPATQD
jgi:hypothetical protein